MADIHLSIPDWLTDNWERAGVSRFDGVTDAVTFLNWCVEETARGRVILSTEPDGTNMTRLAHPVIEAVRQRRQDWLPR